MPLIGKLVVCGVGLIGGSFALALRRAGMTDGCGIHTNAIILAID